MQKETTLWVPLWELKPNTCRWPSGGPFERATFFCGKPTEFGCSWCPEHRRRVFTKGAVKSTFNQVSVANTKEVR